MTTKINTHVCHQDHVSAYGIRRRYDCHRNMTSLSFISGNLYLCRNKFSVLSLKQQGGYKNNRRSEVQRETYCSLLRFYMIAVNFKLEMYLPQCPDFAIISGLVLLLSWALLIKKSCRPMSKIILTRLSALKILGLVIVT